MSLGIVHPMLMWDKQPFWDSPPRFSPAKKNWLKIFTVEQCGSSWEGDGGCSRHAGPCMFTLAIWEGQFRPFLALLVQFAVLVARVKSFDPHRMSPWSVGPASGCLVFFWHVSLYLGQTFDHLGHSAGVRVPVWDFFLACANSPQNCNAIGPRAVHMEPKRTADGKRAAKGDAKDDRATSHDPSRQSESIISLRAVPVAAAYDCWFSSRLT